MSKFREPDIIFKWTNCCRLCLSQESTIDLFSEASISQHFPSKIRTCLNFLVYSGDPMPRKICANCCMKLDSWFQFRKECIQTEKDLKKRLEPYKRIAFVKEYFDKYMKYEKSSQDGSISMDSMSEYDEDEMEDQIGEEDEEDDDDDDDDDDESMEVYSDSVQKEDENSGFSDSDKVMSMPEYQSNENRQIFQKNLSKVSENQNIGNTSNSADAVVMEDEANEAGKSTININKGSIKNRGQEKDRHVNDLAKKFCSTKDVTILTGTGTPATENLEHDGQNSYTHNKSGVTRSKASANNVKGRNSIEKPSVSVQEAKQKTCLDCGVDFHSEEHFLLHNCNAAESGAESDDNDNFINPLSFVDTSLSEPTRETCDGDSLPPVTTPEPSYTGENSDKNVTATSWKCLVCSEYFKSMIDLKQHYNSPDVKCGKKDLNLECELCKCKFSTKDEFVDHKLVHINTETLVKSSDLLKCSQCDNEFEDEAQLSNHACIQDKGETANELEGEYCCSKCEQTFQDKELFEKHELIHNQQDLYNSIATPQFTTFEGIEGMDDAIDESDQYDDDKRPQNVVRCFRCGRIFNTPEELEQHEFIKHKNPTPYFCRKCDLRFSARSQLLMHVRSHMRKSGASDSGGGASDNMCAVCGAKFFLQSDLQSHLKMHKFSPAEDSLSAATSPASQKSWSTPDPYGDNKIDLFARFKCSVCSKIFVHSGSIIRHGKNLHKGQTVYPLRLKRPIFLMKRARSLSLPTDKNIKSPQPIKPMNSNNTVTININTNSQQPQHPQEENFDMEMSQESKWDQDPEGIKSDANLDFGTEKCPFCEKVFKPTYLPRHIKRNHRGEVLDPQMLGKDIPDDSLVCRYCLKSCSNPHNRRVHESIHYPVKMQSTQCKICGQKFFNKATYESHILGCKSVRCGKCNKIFFRYLSLKNHSCIITLPMENKV